MPLSLWLQALCTRGSGEQSTLQYNSLIWTEKCLVKPSSNMGIHTRPQLVGASVSHSFYAKRSEAVCSQSAFIERAI